MPKGKFKSLNSTATRLFLTDLQDPKKIEVLEVPKELREKLRKGEKRAKNIEVEYETKAPKERGYPSILAFIRSLRKG